MVKLFKTKSKPAEDQPLPVSREMTEEEIQNLKKLTVQMEDRGGLDELYKRYHEMYFMTDNTKPKWGDVDENDIVVTVSPSSRNEVAGMVRLLDTSEMQITVKSDGEKHSASDEIETALKTMLRVSGEYRRARVESDAALSAVLYGPVTLYSERLDDLIEVNTKDPYRKAQLEEVRRRTPFIIRTINAEQSYPLWGEFGLMAHLWKYDLKGSALKERWGVECEADKTFTVRDVYDSQFRMVTADGINEPLLAVTHGMKRIPIIQRYAGGTSLFHKPEEQMQSFLFAKARSRLDKRENALLTAISTAINTRGILGPLLAIDPDNVPENIQVKYSGGVRTIVAKATQVDDKVIDPVVFKWKEMLDDLSGQSTIYKQTLGENISGSGSTFSGLAMLSSAGKLPLVDQQRAMEMAFRDSFLNILQRIKAESIENDLIEPAKIPDDVDIEVSMEAKLPQDQLRNATVASSLGPLVSKEWKRTELLQISDSKAMTKQVEKESIRDAMLGAILNDRELMMPFIEAALMPGKSPITSGPPANRPASPPVPDGTSPQIQSADLGGRGGMMGEQLPQTDAMIPPSERQ